MATDVKTLSDKEKALLTCGRGAWHTHAVQDVPEIMMTDGPHGLRKQSDNPANINDSNKATCFPPSCAVASSWDVENARLIGQSIAQEAIAENVSVVLGPGVNIKRSPLCGRNFEYYSEDPLLAGVLAQEYVKGMQGYGVGCCVKHFAVNSQETRRMTVDALVDQRALREIYLAAFERVIKIASPWAVMSSYNMINGYAATENSFLQKDVLRGEWGYDGLVMSDWGASYNTPKAIAAGMDLEMPEDSTGYHRAHVEKALEQGTLAADDINRACENVRRLVEKCKATPKNRTAWTMQQHDDLCRKIAADCAVLLKNDGILPLSTEENLCVVGGLALNPRFQGAGSSHINAQCKNFLDVLKEEGVKAQFAEGYLTDTDKPDDALAAQAVELAKGCDTVLFFGGLTDIYESEGYDRTTLEIPLNQRLLLQEITKVCGKVVFVGFGGAPYLCDWDDSVGAFINMYLGGQAEMAAAFDVIFGRVSPSGRLAETFPQKLSDVPCFNYFANDRYFDEHRESIFVGYRYYNSCGVNVKYPFGYGLSYAAFKYSKLKVSRTKTGFDVSVKVANLSDVAAKEVVQLYVDNCPTALMRPKRELRAFCKVYLEGGASQTVKFSLAERDFSVYLPQKGFTTVNGEYGVCICSDVQTVILSEKVKVTWGENVAGEDYSRAFRLQNGSLTVADDAFYALVGNRRKIDGKFTLKNTLEDLAEKSAVARALKKYVRNMAIKQSPTKNFDDPVAQMVYNGAFQTPLYSLMSMGGVKPKYVLFLLHNANGSHGAALKALFGSYEII